MANVFNVIEKYLPNVVDEFFYVDSKSAVLENGSKLIDVNFNETGYVKIAKVLLDGLSDYYKAQEESLNDPDYASYAGNVGSGYRDGFAIGGVDVEWEIFKLQYRRGREFKIDYISNEETAKVTISGIINKFVKEKVIPEVDATRFSIIAGNTSISLGNRISKAISANTIISEFNDGYEWLSEHEVPSEDQIIFVNPPTMTLIRNTTELEKRLTQTDFTNDKGVTFKLNAYENRPIIEVPSSRFFTDVLTTKNGYRAQNGSKAINFIIMSKRAVVPIRKLEWNKIYGPELSGLVGFHGYVVNFLIWHGVVVPENAIPGIYCCVSTTDASTKTNLLNVDTQAGGAQYAWKYTRHFTTPAGLRGYVVFNTQAFTLGVNVSTLSEVTSTANLGNGKYMVAEKDADVTELAGSKSYYFALVDATGTIIATSGLTAVVQHA